MHDTRKLGSSGVQILSLREERCRIGWNQCHFPDSVPCKLQDQYSAIFLVPANVYGIPAGILLCVAFGPRHGHESSVAFKVEMSIDGRTISAPNCFFGEVESDAVWLKYHYDDKLSQLLEKDMNILEVSLSSPSGGHIKGCGVRVLWEKEEDELQIFQPRAQTDYKNEDQKGSHRDLEAKRYPITVDCIIDARNGAKKAIVTAPNITRQVGLQLLLA